MQERRKVGFFIPAAICATLLGVTLGNMRADTDHPIMEFWEAGLATVLTAAAGALMIGAGAYTHYKMTQDRQRSTVWAWLAVTAVSLAIGGALLLAGELLGVGWRI